MSDEPEIIGSSEYTEIEDVVVEQGTIPPPPPPELPRTNEERALLQSKLNAATMMKAKLQANDRLTIRQEVIQEHWGDDPVIAKASGIQFIGNREQAYSGRIYVQTGKLRQLPLSHLNETAGIGVVCLKNVTGQGKTEQPTKEEKENLEKQWLLIYVGNQRGVFGENPFIVRPGGMFVAEPQDAQFLWLGSAFGEVTVKVHLFGR